MKKTEDKKYDTVTIKSEAKETLRRLAIKERRSMLQQLSIIIEKFAKEEAA